MLSNLGYAIGRVMIAAIFVISGWAKVVDVSGIAGMLSRASLPQPRLLGYVAGAVELVAGVLVAIGYRTRWAALVLVVFTAVATYIGHAFWTMEGAQYAAQRLHAQEPRNHGRPAGDRRVRFRRVVRRPRSVIARSKG